MFMCAVCRREREEACHVERLDCCGETFPLCAERCATLIPATCRGMTVQEYAALYRRIHEIVCRDKYRM